MESPHPSASIGSLHLGPKWVYLLLGSVTFLALLLWLKDGHLLMPQAGTQSVLAAHALLDGRGLELDPGVPFSKYPPLYPLLLAPLEACGIGVVPAVYGVNVATLALTLCALLALARAMGLRAALLAPLVYLGLGSTHYLLRAARGDAVVICASILVILALTIYARKGSRTALLAAAAICAVAGLARYMALFTLVPVGVIGVLAIAGRFPAGQRRRWRDGSLFAAVACLPLGLWLVRNLIVKGFAFGIPKVSETRAGAEGTTFLNNVMGLVGTTLTDLFGYDSLGVIRVVHGDMEVGAPSAMYAGAGVASLGLVFLGVQLRRARAAQPAPERAAARHGQDADPATWARRLLVAYVVVYSLALIAIWSVGQNDPIHTRYVAPLYAPLILLVMDLGTRAGRLGRSRIADGVCLGVAALVLLPNVQKSVKLLGEEPPERLIELTSRQGRLRWHRSLTWDLRGVADDQD